MVDNRVNGRTQVYGVIGDPVSHSFSPQIHNTIAMALGDDMIYEAFHVKPEKLRGAIEGAYSLGIQGLNVTIPHKPFVMEFLSETDISAEMAGAANTLVYTENGYKGYNTDIYGIINSLSYNGVEISGKRALVIGAGGTARAALAALIQGGASEIHMANRTVEKAEELGKRMGSYYKSGIKAISLKDVRSLEGLDLVIQTTPAGFGAQDTLSPVQDKVFFTNVGAVMDVIYTPWETRFLQMAKEAGCLCINGFEMLILQGVKAYSLWRGRNFHKDFIKALTAELADYYIRHK